MAQETGKAEREEMEHFEAVARSFGLYEEKMSLWLEHCKAEFLKLPIKHQKLLEQAGFVERQAQMRKAVEINSRFTRLLVEEHSFVFDHGSGNRKKVKLSSLNQKLACSEHYADRVRTTLSQMARDWSEEGKEERELCYGTMISALLAEFSNVSVEERNQLKVLTPGAGLGRLTFEISQLGFESQGNEFSYFMLLASSFILNRTTKAEQFEISPWIRQTTNVLKKDDLVRVVKIPDVSPSSKTSTKGNLSMSAGDFLEIYGNDSEQFESWNAVLTCFFIDTAHNALDYVETIAKILKPGCPWINLGPLLWHFADIPGENSVELTWEELKSIITSSGLFAFKKEEERKRLTYDSNNRSLLRVYYDCLFFVAIRTNQKI